MAGVRDEGLRAVQDVLVAAALGRRLDPRDVRAGVRLGQPEGAEDRLLEQRRQPLRLLLVRAGDDHRRRTEAVRANRRGDARAAPVELLADEHPVECGQPGPAERLGNMEVHEAQLVCLGDHIGRVRRVLVVCGGFRPYLLLGELACERAQLALLRGEGERDAARDTGLDLGHGPLS